MLLTMLVGSCSEPLNQGFAAETGRKRDLFPLLNIQARCVKGGTFFVTEGAGYESLDGIVSAEKNRVTEA